jgi:hypothetical protein
MARPSKASNLEVDPVPVVVFHGFIIDDVNDGNDKSFWVLFDALQQRS